MDENNREAQVRIDLLSKLDAERARNSANEQHAGNTAGQNIGIRRVGGIVGGRSDGTMEPGIPPLAPLQRTHDAINHIMQNETALRHQLEDANRSNERLEKECLLLKHQLDTEHVVRQALEATIRQIAEIVVNGSKAPGT